MQMSQRCGQIAIFDTCPGGSPESSLLEYTSMDVDED